MWTVLLIGFLPDIKDYFIFIHLIYRLHIKFKCKGKFIINRSLFLVKNDYHFPQTKSKILTKIKYEKNLQTKQPTIFKSCSKFQPGCWFKYFRRSPAISGSNVSSESFLVKYFRLLTALSVSFSSCWNLMRLFLKEFVFFRFSFEG